MWTVSKKENQKNTNKKLRSYVKGISIETSSNHNEFIPLTSWNYDDIFYLLMIFIVYLTFIA